MPTLSEILKDLIRRHGGNKTAIAKKLRDTGIKGLQKMSSQRLGQYADGKMEPKSDFYKGWKQVFNEDIESMIETNVSHETNYRNLKHQIFEGDYMGMHKRAWDQFEETFNQCKEMLKQAHDNNAKLVQTNSELSQGVLELSKTLAKTGVVKH